MQQLVTTNHRFAEDSFLWSLEGNYRKSVNVFMMYEYEVSYHQCVLAPVDVG